MNCLYGSPFVFFSYCMPFPQLAPFFGQSQNENGLKQQELRTGSISAPQKQFNIPKKCISSENIKLFQAIEKKIQRMHSVRYSRRKLKNCWTEQQDDHMLLIAKREQYNWKQISKEFKNRSPIACARRYDRIVQGYEEKRMFSTETKQRMVSIIEEHGVNWHIIQQLMPDFKPDQLRAIHEHIERPPNKKHAFSFTEDVDLIRFVLEKGENWAELELEMEGRTQAQIRNRYEQELKKIEIQARRKLKM